MNYKYQYLALWRAAGCGEDWWLSLWPPTSLPFGLLDLNTKPWCDLRPDNKNKKKRERKKKKKTDHTLSQFSASATANHRQNPYIRSSPSSQVSEITFPSVGNSVRNNSWVNLHICAPVGPKTITGKALSRTSSSAITAETYPFTWRFSSSLSCTQGVSVCLFQRRLDHPSPGTMCKCGKAVFCAVFAAGSLISAGWGERGLTPTVLFLTWSTGCFYSPDMWTRLEKMTFHRAPTYDSTQRHRTELSPPFINGSCQTTVISTFRHSILVECVIYAPGSLNVTPSGLLEIQYVVFK